jgi:carboxyl-terminal processing protease
MLTKRVHTLLSVLAGAVIGAGLALMRGVLADREPPPAPPTAAAVTPAHALLDVVAERVRREYVDAVTDDQLEAGAAAGMVESLDPHSAFLNAAEYDEMRVSTAGSYSGVGIEVAAQDGRIVVVTPIDGSPAALAGVRSGDVLDEIDGQPVQPGRLDETIARMRGPSGTRVRLEVSRPGEPAPLEFELERTEVHVRTVRAEPLPGRYGYVRITHFNDSTPHDFEQVLADLQGGGAAPLRGLVLDLRGNPGGVLESAVDVADEFLDSGVIVRADGRTAESRFEMDATAGDLLLGAPLVVLVDRGSASGAEIVAGALRDHGRATLMGERTFGKGSVQTVMPLKDGQALKLTTSRYYTPSGASIHERGLQPDVAIAAAGDPAQPLAQGKALDDRAVQSALQYLRDRSLGTQVALAGQN